MIRFVNRVAEVIEREFPRVTVTTLAYQITRKPSKRVRPRANVMVMLCTFECSFSQTLGRPESHVTCVEPAWDENRFVCVASRGKLTNVFTVDASAPTMVPVGSIEGHFYPTAVSSGGVVVGSWNGTPALLRLPERRIERLAEHLGESAINGGAVGFVHAQLGDTEAVVFRRKP